MSEPSNPQNPPEKDTAKKGKTAEFRWQPFFQRSAEPLFLLDGQRRVVFVSNSFTSLTGFPLEELRGRSCRHHAAPGAGSIEALLSVLAPPLEALEGKPASIRRPSLDKQTRYWDISYFPFRQQEGLAGILGKITPVAPLPETKTVPLPPRLFSLRDRARQWHRMDHLHSEVPAMRGVLERVRLAVQTVEPVWLSGEAGTGKSWLARLIHDQGLTRERYFVALDCQGLPAPILVETFFGHRSLLASAFTGTLYLKEPQFLSKEIQLRLCEWRSAERDKTDQVGRPRVILGSSLTQPQPADFLEEFLHTFSVVRIDVPPLRERKADLKTLGERLLQRAADATGRKVRGLSEEAWEVVQGFSWPGNLQELFTVLRQACGRASAELIQADDLPWYLRTSPAPVEKILNLDAILEQVERRLMLLALEKSKETKTGQTTYNKTRAAQLLTIWRARLIRRLQDLGIEEKEDKTDETGPGAGV